MRGSFPPRLVRGSGGEVDELADRRAGFERREALVDLAERDAARYQMVELEPALAVEGEQPRHVHAKAVAAHRGALDLAVAQEVEAVQLDLHAEGNHADDRRGAARAQHLKGLLGGRL